MGDSKRDKKPDWCWYDETGPLPESWPTRWGPPPSTCGAPITIELLDWLKEHMAESLNRLGSKPEPK